MGDEGGEQGEIRMVPFLGGRGGGTWYTYFELREFEGRKYSQRVVFFDAKGESEIDGSDAAEHA